MAWSLPEGGVLGIFGQQPTPGRVKPRLAAEFGDEAAAAMQEAMLFDLLETWGSDRVLTPGGRRVLVYDPPEAGPWFDPRVAETFALQPQVDGDLGQRLHAFFAGEFEDGASKVVVISSDAPLVDDALVISAFLCLDGRDVVIGPSSDGGYYLIGSRMAAPPVFDEIDWGSPRVLAQTIDRLKDTGLSLALLPPSYYVGTPDEWRVLAGQIRALRRAGMSPHLPRVESLIESFAS